jgi:CubicO group peptidase (beta-lactamase class C family)
MRPATPATRYRIGSTSKSVTVTATARLVDQGVVDLDAPISTYSPALPPHWRALTLRQLHSHTAGLPGYENNFDIPGLIETLRKQRHYEDVADSLELFDGASLRYTPGEDFHYSSFDVVLASAVLQAAAGAPFLDVLQREVLTPFGMAATSADYADREIPERARFYDRSAGGVRAASDVDLSARYAAGGLISTSSDLLRLGIGYLHGDLLRAETVASLWTPQRLANGEVNEQNYALGWRSNRRVVEEFGTEIWRVDHGGVSTGAMARLCVYPERDIVLAFNSNTEAETFEAFTMPANAIAKLFANAV